jgi:periplasmic copper chaperone A
VDRRIQCAASVLTRVLVFVFVLPALAADQHAGSLTVTQAWSRATPPGAVTGAAYFEIINAGAVDTLVRIESPVAREVETHMSSVEGGMMHMRPMSSVKVPEHGRLRFDPNGLHVMLIDLQQPLKEGQRFPMTLVFQHAGRVSIEVVVRGLGATSAPTQEGGAHEHR